MENRREMTEMNTISLNCNICNRGIVYKRETRSTTKATIKTIEASAVAPKNETKIICNGVIFLSPFKNFKVKMYFF